MGELKCGGQVSLRRAHLGLHTEGVGLGLKSLTPPHAGPRDTYQQVLAAEMSDSR